MGRHRPAPAAGPTALGLLAAVAVTASCLRSPVSAVGAELDAIRAALGLGPLAAGALTAAPLAVFAVAGLIAPALLARVGARVVVLGGVGVVAVGLLARAGAGDATTFLGATVVALAAVGVVNVVLPPAVAGRSPWAAGVFSVGVLAGIAAPAALAVPVGALTGTDWRGGIGVWALLAVLALALWPRAVAALPRRVPAPDAHTRPLRRPVLPVALAVFFAAQSLGAFAVMGWLPAIYRDAGLDPSSASRLLAVTVVLAVPAALLLPRSAGRGDPRRVRTAVVAVGAAQSAGLTGLLLAPGAAPWAWAVLLTAAHCGFPLAIGLIVRHGCDGDDGDDGDDGARLSAAVQGTGYALAVAGPLLLGPLRAATGAWTVPLAVLVAVALVQVLAGLAALDVPHPRRPRPDLHPDPEPDPDPDGDPHRDRRDRSARPVPPRHPSPRGAARGPRHRGPRPAARRTSGAGRAAEQRRDHAAPAGGHGRGHRHAR